MNQRGGVVETPGSPAQLRVWTDLAELPSQAGHLLNARFPAFGSPGPKQQKLFCVARLKKQANSREPGFFLKPFRPAGQHRKQDRRPCCLGTVCWPFQSGAGLSMHVDSYPESLAQFWGHAFRPMGETDDCSIPRPLQGILHCGMNSRQGGLTCAGPNT